MEVILKRDYKSLGYKNDTVSVAPGYARNFLIPRKIVTVATESAKKIAAENIKQTVRKVEKLRKDAQNVAAKLAKMVIVIKAKVGDNGKLFGNVNNQQISEAIKKQTNYNIDKRDITFTHQIKQVGNDTVIAKLYRDVNAEININVVAAE